MSRVPRHVAVVVLVLSCIAAFAASCTSTPGPVDPRFMALHNAFSAMGLAQVGPVQQGTLVEGREARLPIELQAQCTTLVAMGGEGVRDIDLSVLDPTGNVVAHDATHDSQAVVRACVDHPGSYTMLVKMAAGSGDFLAATWTGNAVGAAPAGSAAIAAQAGQAQGTCDSPIPIVPGVIQGNTSHGESNNECSDPQSDGQELVYRLDVQSQKRLLIEVDAHYDAVLYVRKDDCNSPDDEVKCNDDDQGNAQRSRIDVVIDPGVYFIFVDGFRNGAGSFRMSVALQDVPQLADVCRQAHPLGTAGSTQNGTTHGAFDLAHSSCSSNSPGPEVPYHFDLSQRSRVRFTLESSDMEPNVYVRKTCTDEHSEVACFDTDSAVSSQQAVFVGVLDPGSYTVFADTSTPDADNAQFALTQELAPENGTGGTGDGCSDALPLTTSTTASGDTFDTKDDISGRCTGNGAPDVVYRIDLARRSRIRARFTEEEGKNAHQGGHVLVLQKTCGDRSTELACADSIDTVLAPGTYYLAVDGATPSSFGKFNLEYSVQDVTSQEAACRIATPLTDGQTVSGNTKGAKNVFEESCAGGDSRSNTAGDRLYKIVLTRRATISLVLTTTTWDGVLALRRACLDPTGASGPHAAEVSCNNDSEDAQHSRITTTLDPGTYFVVVDGYRGTEGSYTLSYTVHK